MATLRHSPIFELIPAAQSYDWGKLGSDGSKVSQMAMHQPGFEYDASKPYAELWMGSHPTLPSRLVSNRKPLGEYIKTHPWLLGDKVKEVYGEDLPFLFKVLAIGKALSIQAHPDKTLAETLHKERPDVYKDGNHKPEMAIAVTPFSGFCGFRPLPEISTFLGTVPEFSTVVGADAAKAFLSAIPSESTSPDFNVSSKTSPDALKTNQAALQALFSALMNAEPGLVKQSVDNLVARYKKESPEKVKQYGTIEELVVRLDTQFPGDVGVFCTYVLNVVELKPGQAAFLKANEPHAYLTGDIIECMATSDNVVRAGLTPKLRDVPTLTSMLTYTYGPASSQLMTPVPYKTTSYTTLYDPPIAEFSVLLTDIPSAGTTDVHPAIDGPSILLVTEGVGELKVGPHDADVTVERTGQVFFIAAGNEVKLTAKEGRFVSYRAFVEVGETEGARL